MSDFERNFDASAAPSLRLEVLTQVGRGSLIGSMLMAALYAAALYAMGADPGNLASWFAGISGVCLLGLILWRIIGRTGTEDIGERRQKMLCSLIVALLGACWGATVPLFYSGADFTIQVLTAFTLPAAYALWAPTLIALPSASWGLAVPLAGSIVAAPVYSGSSVSWYLAAAILLFFGVGWILLKRGADALALGRRIAEENRVLDNRIDEAQSKLKRQDQRWEETARQLRATKEAAEAANIAKSEFLATVSHEIRTPLNGLLPVLDLLQETPLETDQRAYLRTAIESSRHLLSIIDSILDYSKIEAGKLEVESLELNLRAIIASVIEMMTGAAESRGLYLRPAVARDVPKNVRGDPIRLRQVLTNLVSNAIKFTERGGVTVELSAGETSRTEVGLLFSVRDTGVGLSEEAASKLFRPFHQADASTTRNYGGSGLGLAISKRLVEMMNGQIGVKSKPSQGSTFWFRIRFRRSAHDVPPARQDVRNVRTLLVCDDAEEYGVLKTILESWGMIHERADSTESAYEVLRSSYSIGASWGYELVIVDAAAFSSISITDMVRRVRGERAFKDVRFIALVSATADTPEVREVVEGVVSRPLRSAAVQRVVYRVLDVDEGKHASAQQEDLSRFRPSFTLFGNEPKPAPEPKTGVHQDSAPVTRTKRGHVLLVEDNPVNLQVARKLLDRLGTTCETATDGKQALDRMRKGGIDAVLMDCQMPELDGYEATRRFRNEEKVLGSVRLPIIAITANVMAGDREKCVSAGMDDYLGKPISAAALGGVLDKWLPGGRNVKPRNENPAISAPTSQGEPQELDLDSDTLRELFDVMEEEFTDILATFLESAPRLIQQISEAAERSDIEAMVVPAHSLKSSAANVGAQRLSKDAKALELAARQNDKQQCLAASTNLPETYESAAQELREVIARGSP